MGRFEKWFNKKNVQEYINNHYEEEDYDIRKILLKDIDKRIELINLALPYTKKTSLRKRHESELLELINRKDFYKKQLY